MPGKVRMVSYARSKVLFRAASCCREDAASLRMSDWKLCFDVKRRGLDQGGMWRPVVKNPTNHQASMVDSSSVSSSRFVYRLK